VPGHHELRLFNSWGPVLNSWLQNGVCLYTQAGIMRSVPAPAVSSLCPVLLQFTGHTAPPVHNTGHPVSTDPYRWRVSRAVKSRSYRHSGRTDSIHRCCYECYQRTQFTEDNAEPSFMPGINSFHLWLYLFLLPSVVQIPMDINEDKINEKNATTATVHPRVLYGRKQKPHCSAELKRAVKIIIIVIIFTLVDM